jgi:hypothetical protein
MAIDPKQVLNDKANTLAKASGKTVDSIAAGAKVEFPGLVAQVNQGLTTAGNNVRVLADKFSLGDSQIGLDSLTKSASAFLPAIGTGISEFKEGFGNVSKLLGATGITDSVTEKLEELTGFAPKVPIKDALASSEGVVDSKVGINSVTAKTKPAGKSTIIGNQLEQYASFNCIFELGALSSYSINNPELTYRKNGSDVTILRSGGGGLDDNRVQTIYDALGKEAGNLEYFIDEVNIDAIVAPSKRSGLSQATKIEFTVHEPYSMGLFLQAVQAAARDAGFQNYLQAPYMLELDFVGWDDNGNAVPVEYANRKIPFKLANIEFDVERGGSVYRVSAYPWNEVALLDEYQVIQDQISISGPSVLEAITTGPNSLTTVINDAIASAALAKGDPVSDFYIIRFPTVRTALNGLDSLPADEEGVILQRAETVRAVLGTQAGADANANRRSSFFNESFSSNVSPSAKGDGSPLQIIRNSTLQDVNSIGFSPMVPLENPKGDQPFGLGLYTYDADNDVYKRDGIELEITNDVRTFKFEKGTKLTKIIEEMVLISEYGKAAMSAANDDKESMIPWFRIEPQLFVIDDWVVEEQTGKKAKVWVYNVVPYEVASSTFVAPNQEVAVKERAKQAVKSYDYIYSGENKDVLGFEIQFNAAFFTAIQADYGEGSERPNTAEGLTAQQAGVAYNVSSGETTGNHQGGQVVRRPEVRNFTQGSYNLDAGQNLARQFHEALLNSEVDLITADLEIWGDPYYLTDSGVGNYNAPGSNTSVCLTKDGCADYQQGHVHILINFRTPIDYNQDGSMFFPEDTQAVKGFSGLYRVLSVNSVFQGNQFKQVLKVIREKNQTMEGAVQQQKRQAIGQDQKAQSLNTESNVAPSEEVGVERNSSVAAARNIPSVEPLSEDGPLATVGSSVNTALKVQVAELVAENFQALIDDLEQTYGYDIRALGGYSRRNAVGSQNWSYHASGLALDINPAENGMIRPRPKNAPEPTDMPEDGTGSAMEALAAKHGLGWGGAWNSLTDAMHFSAAKAEFGSLDWPRNGIIPGNPNPPPTQTTGEVNEVPAKDPDTDDPRGQDQRNTVSGTQSVTDAAARRQQAGGTAATAAEEQEALQNAMFYDDAIMRQQRVSSPTTNSQGEVTGLRPYYPINPQDDRYDFNTGDKIKAILKARNGN